MGKSFAPPPVFDWTGSYAGFNAGWIYSESDAQVGAASPGFAATIAIGLQPTRLSSNGSGFLAGLTLGHNMQFGSSFVAGIEADIAYTDVGYSGTGVRPPVPFLGPPLGVPTTAPTTISTELEWFGTLRARAGWLASRQLLLYATGGLAYANVEHRGVQDVIPPCCGFTNPSALGSSSEWKAGWTVGGEWLLGNKTTIKAEYLYYDLGDTDVTLASTGIPGEFVTWDVENKGHIVRMGLNVQLY